MTRYIPPIALLLAYVSAVAQVPEGSAITISGIYRYGTDSKAAHAYVTAPASCSNATFGDPAPSKAKTCALVPVNAASCVLPVMGGAGQAPDFGFGSAGGWVSWWCPSTKGPQLRVVAGSVLASISSMKCFVSSTESPSRSLAKCAPGSALDAGPRAAWTDRETLARIVATKP